MDLMHKLAKLSEDERGRLIADFLDAAFGDLDAFAGVRSSMTPELPDNPEPEQVEAWVELAELAQDPDFRAVMRRIAEQHAESSGLRRDFAAVVRDRVGPALAAGVDPASPRADAVVAAVMDEYARLSGRPDDAHLRHRLLARVEAANDPRREAYLQRLAVINEWQAPESLAPVFDWVAEAVRLRT
jgi:hypothetical protein